MALWKLSVVSDLLLRNDSSSIPELTNSMKQSPSRESDSFLAIQKIRCVYPKLKVHYRIHKRPPPVPILSQIITVLGPFSFFKFPFHLLLPHMPRSSKFSLSHKFPQHNIIGIHHLPHTCYMPRPPHTFAFDNRHNIWWWVDIIKLLSSVTFSLLDPNSILNTTCPQSISLPAVWETKFHNRMK